MKKTLIGLGIAACLVITSCVVYYFIFFLPQLKEQEAALERQKQIVDEQVRCEREGRKKYFVEPAESRVTYHTQLFTFNPDLYKCIYYYSLSDFSQAEGGMKELLIRKGLNTEYFVQKYALIDVYESTEIAEYTCFANRDCDEQKRQQFLEAFTTLLPGKKAPFE